MLQIILVGSDVVSLSLNLIRVRVVADWISGRIDGCSSSQPAKQSSSDCFACSSLLFLLLGVPLTHQFDARLCLL
jgi:hypothetical protein